MLAISSFEVQEDVEGQELDCVTEHPGFIPVCLNKWCLRLSADKYMKKDGKRYRKTGFENELSTIVLHVYQCCACSCYKRNDRDLIMRANSKE